VRKREAKSKRSNKKED